jgi:hypothetical protein
LLTGSARRNEDVGQAEAPYSAAAQGWLPVRIERSERFRVGVDDADNDLANQAATYRTQLLTAVEDLRLFEDVEPEWCLAPSR